MFISWSTCPLRNHTHASIPIPPHPAMFITHLTRLFDNIDDSWDSYFDLFIDIEDSWGGFKKLNHS